MLKSKAKAALCHLYNRRKKKVSSHGYQTLIFMDGQKARGLPEFNLHCHFYIRAVHELHKHISLFFDQVITLSKYIY